jgi:hypothetical protein
VDRQELHAAITRDLADRSAWETRQEKFYRMRHNGLRRSNKPYPTASDVHFPLADMAIEKLKPYYFQQVAATEVVAKFVPLSSKTATFTSAAEQWFDFQVKQRSNFEEEFLRVIDHELMSGFAVMSS